MTKTLSPIWKFKLNKCILGKNKIKPLPSWGLFMTGRHNTHAK